MDGLVQMFDPLDYENYNILLTYIFVPVSIPSQIRWQQVFCFFTKVHMLALVTNMQLSVLKIASA
jgi:hypothetical protein